MNAFPVRLASVMAVAIAVTLVQEPPARTAATNIPNDERAIAHALNRLGFGARPGGLRRGRVPRQA